jgi:hypothetical protein
MSDIKPSETNTPAETPASAAPAAAEQISLSFSETKIEPPKSDAIKSDAIASEPPRPETAAAPQAVEPPKPVAAQKALELPKPEAVAPLAADKPKVAPIKPIVAAAANQDSSASRSNRFAAMATSVAFAAAVGSLVGALAFSVISRPGPASADSSATALDLSKLRDTITSVRSEIAALKASIDSGARNTNAQFAKAAERFERIERSQSASAAQLTKSIESLDRRTDSASASIAKDATGSVRPPGAPTPPADTLRGPMLDGWIVRNVVRNVAFIQGRRMGVIEVETGDIVPGVGRIQSIRKHTDGRWVVVTSKGMITSR